MLLYQWLEEIVKHKGGAKGLLYRDTYLSWRGLMHRVDRRASEFASMGVRPGDWVGLMLGNVPDFIILAVALNKLRAAPLPLDPTTSTRELEMILAAMPVRGLITRPRGGDAPLPTAPSLAPKKKRGAAATDVNQRTAPEFRKRLQNTLLSCALYPRDPLPVPANEADTIAAVLCTGDSAGDPKAVERTSRNLLAEADSVCDALQLTGDDHALLTFPMYHSFGFCVGFLAALRAGASIYLEDDVVAAKVLKLVREHTITMLPGAVSLFEEFGRLPAPRPFAHKPVRLVSAGGGLTGPALETFHKKYGVRPLSCFHTTETGTISVDARGQSGDSVGKPVKGIDVRVTNPKSGKPAAVGRKGSLWVRGDAISPLNFAPKQNPSDAGVPVGGYDGDQWYHTGDLVTVDRTGKIRLQGREDDIVRLDGKRVALGEVEGCIESHPNVSAAQAGVITDPFGGPVVVAKVVLKDRTKLAPEELIDFCAKNLSPYKVPRRITFCNAL